MAECVFAEVTVRSILRLLMCKERQILTKIAAFIVFTGDLHIF